MTILLQEVHLSRIVLLLFIPKTARKKEEQALGEGESCVIGLSVLVSREKPTVEMITNSFLLPQEVHGVKRSVF